MARQSYSQDFGAIWFAGLVGGGGTFFDLSRDIQFWYALEAVTFAGASHIVYRSASVAGPWTSVTVTGATGFPGFTYDRALVVGTDDTIYTYGFDGTHPFLWRSLDQAATPFTKGANPINTTAIRSINWIWQSYAGTIFAPRVPASVPGRVRRSVDKGDNWADQNMPASYNAPLMLAQSPVGVTIYGITSGFGPLAGQQLLVKSNDDGQTWVNVPVAAFGGLIAWQFLIVTRAGSLIVTGTNAAGHYGVWRSTDGGVNWVQVFNLLAISTLWHLRQANDANQTVFGQYTSGGVAFLNISADDGATWAATATGVPGGIMTGQTFAVDRQYHR